MSQPGYILVFVILLWLGVLTYLIYKISLRYKKLIEGVDKKNLLEILDRVLKNLSRDETELEIIKKEVKRLTEEGFYHVQKVGIVRFNPFADTGGDQSFVLTVLDGRDNGIVLTSLHNRGLTRWYAKNVINGKGVDHELSKEEQQAIKKALPVRK
ncbi:hypothetical protein A2Y99_04925 [Candidatus Gottesmanbacteria bacterium RBG_13_37_7]|uniref:DUF4446 domain-containing protein n=1 Tax=Candidatus Gottesmanbacteria bacterium RBG_13_37_7 TaxID=1798369 RepID=A0A1F5YGP8_9BACT|nr:MAG: hypothetical protein A2Y99_04925 [Candidatus Gottesmanbacteria bacterium RBG_13_37_7]